MRPTHQPPIHPGEILLEEFLKPLGIRQTAFATHLGWTNAKLNEIIKGRRGVTVNAAVDIADALGTTPGLWINLQTNYDLWHALKDRQPKMPIHQKAS